MPSNQPERRGIQKRASGPAAATLATLAALAPLAGVATAAEPVPWAADRPLRWSDFGGIVASDTAPENVAATVASLRWTYAYEFERAGEHCTYRLTDIRAAATFHPDESWVKPDHRTTDVLAHEQGHFDITQIHKLMFEAATRDLIGAGGSCRGRNDNRISRFIREEAGRRIGAIYDDVWLNHTRAQELYDLETGHGTRATSQRAWLERIAEGLNGGRWGETSLAASDR